MPATLSCGGVLHSTNASLIGLLRISPPSPLLCLLPLAAYFDMSNALLLQCAMCLLKKRGSTSPRAHPMLTHLAHARSHPFTAEHLQPGEKFECAAARGLSGSLETQALQ